MSGPRSGLTKRVGARLRAVALWICLLMVVQVLSPSPVAAASPVPGPCIEGTLPHGALSLICVPSNGWNGDLLIFAHGYVAFDEPLQFAHLSFGGIFLPDIAQILGFAFATTSYRQNGLAVLEGVDDVRELVAAFAAIHGAPGQTYLLGASEGGLIATLLVERSPQLFTGVLAMCGPIGNFRSQIDHVGDFRVLFDYFFPGVIPGTATAIPAEVLADWESVYAPRALAALSNDPAGSFKLLIASRGAVDWDDLPSTWARTVLGLLWYNVFATNDAVDKLGGNPFDNTSRWYSGSADDIFLNLGVRRYAADPEALAALADYATAGSVSRPFVALHTTGDEIVPFQHELDFLDKLDARSEANVSLLPLPRYGHCGFRPEEVFYGFLVLLVKVGQTTDAERVRRLMER